jgi:hypothetical protein
MLALLAGKYGGGKLTSFTIISLCLIFLSSVFQYMLPTIDAVLHSSSFYFSIDASYLNEGWSRYIKDICLVLFSMIFPFFVLGNKSLFSSVSLKLPLFFLVWIAIQSIFGHIYSQSLGHFIAGSRWLMNLYCSVGVFWVVVILNQKNGVYTRLILNNVFIFITFVSFLFAFLQWAKMGFSSFSGMRINSLYGNAGVFGFVIIAIGLYFYVSGMKFIHKSIIFSILFFMSALSGTRTAMMCILILFYFLYLSEKVLSSSKTKNKSLLVFFVIISFIFAYIGLLIVNAVADRGSLLDNLSGGRMDILIKAVLDLDNESAFLLLFGRGLGFGTNMAIILDLVANHENIMDSTIATWIVQFGLVGFGAALLVPVSIFWFNYKKSLSNNMHLAIVILVFLLAGFNQNVFENYFLLPMMGIVLANVGSKDRCQKCQC